MSWIEQRPYVTFVVLSCVLSWWVTLLSIEDLPILPIGPLLAALIVILVTKRGKGLREWARTSFRWRVGPLWYVLAIAFPIAMNGAAAGLNILLGATASTAIWPTNLTEWLVEAIIVFILIAVGEEMGFSGFGLPHLLRKNSVLTTVAILGLTRILWHVPLFLIGETDWTVALILIPAQLVFTWLFLRSGGSAFLIILSHASMAIVAFPVFSSMFSGADSSRMAWLEAAMFILTGAVLLLTSKTMRSGAPFPDDTVEREAPAVVVP